METANFLTIENMDKIEQQNKIWNDLSEESKSKIQQDYKTLQMGLSTGLLEGEDFAEQVGKIKELEELFGPHNLNPKQIKTWEDMIDNDKFEEIDSTYVELEDFLINKDMDSKLRNKILATYQIQQLIDLGYGGIITEGEWFDVRKPKYVIRCVYEEKQKLENDISYRNKYFIAFHTEKQREEFMYHESNRNLVSQYFMT